MTTGLTSARAYAGEMQSAYETAASGAAALVAGLDANGVSGPAVDAVERAHDLTRQAGAAWVTAGEALDKQTGVREAYLAAHDAGDKAFLTDADPAPPDNASPVADSATSCVFCAIIAGEAPAEVVHRWSDVIAIRPRHPVTPGHVLVIPHAHVSDVGEQPAVSARTMTCAAELAATLPAANVITSKGSVATQTVYHLHLHVVPRQENDDLPLPWTPQQQAAAQRRAQPSAAPPALPAGTSGVEVVWAREPIPVGPSVFLAGPTPRADSVPSWRPAAIAALRAAWTGAQPLIVLTPESRGGKRAAEYHHQVDWEAEGLETASAILFWIPRDVATLPGFTTNVEFGLHVRSGRVVLGAPADCPNPERNRYLIWAARRHGVPVLETLDATVRAALDLVPAAGRPR